MEFAPLCFIVLLIVGIFYLAVWSMRRERNKALAQARAKYQRALADLRNDPGNSRIREAALAFGRAYAAKARENGQRTIFDEMALANDLAAIPVPATVAAPAPTTNAEDRLRQLAGLRDKGMITPDEYEARRQQIIRDV